MNQNNEKKFRIEAPSKWEHIAVVKGFIGDKYIGVAKLTRDGARAKLADIEIVSIKLPVSWLIPFIKVKRNYRGRGYGSLLLDATIEYCISQKIKSIEGEAAGDTNFLIPWYRRHGFEVGEDNMISMSLKA